MESIERIGSWFEDFYRKNDIKILSRIRYTGIVAGPILAAAAGIRAYKELKSKKECSLKEKILICAKHAAVPTIVTTATIVATNKVDQKYIASKEAIATLAVLTEKEYKELKEAQKEVVGEEKSKEIEKKADENKAKASGIENLEVNPQKGIYGCIEPKTGQVFPTTKATLDQAITNLYRTTTSGKDYTMQDFVLDAGGYLFEFGESFGWEGKLGIEYYVSYDNFHDRNGNPCFRIIYGNGSEPTIIND